MPRRSYRKRSKRYTRRKAKKTSIRRIIKKTVLGIAETKKKYLNVLNNDFNNGWQGTNLIYWIGQGTDDHTRIGDKIQLRGIKFRASIVPALPSQGAATSAYPFQVRFVCFKKKANAHSGTTGPSFSENIKPDTIGGTGLTEIIDTEKCTVVFDKIYNGTTNLHLNNPAANLTVSQYPYVFIDHYWKINKNLQFEGDNSGYAKGWNYYFAFYPSWPATLESSTHYAEFNTCTYYKDI